MANFDYLSKRGDYELFGPACIEAERVLTSSPAMCAVGCRKALELAVKWVYAADNTMKVPYRDNLQALIHEPSFRFAVERVTWGKLPYIVKLGNVSVHTERRIRKEDATLALRSLFDFIQWLDYCYGTEYEERTFDESAIPTQHIELDEKAIRERESLLAEKDERIKQLEAQIAEASWLFTAGKEGNKRENTFNPDEIPEYETRKRYIDLDLEYAGWDLDKNVETEVEINDMEGNPGQLGFIDYVLNGKDGRPLALLEAKRTMYDPNKGLQQARLYAESLERKYGYKPFVFLSNGFEYYFCDDVETGRRPVSGVFSQADLMRLMNRRGEALPLSTVRIDEAIAGRYYQMEAIRAVCANLEEGHRKSLLVMATGTGKTRVSASLLDVLARGGHVTNTLFLADRIALVSQAKSAFQSYLPDMTLCNLCKASDRKDSKDARVVFSTYPTILNAIDEVRNADGERLYTPAHFDLIIVDEAHRSIFKKYKAIFDYFDAHVVGLTATPKNEVDRNTYDFFEVERGVPTYVYEYDTAVYQDHVLVPYYNIEVSTTFLEEGITYDDLSDEDKERYEDDWEEAVGELPPDFVPSSKVDKWVFNEQTCDMVLQDLMENGIKVNGGEQIGKTIIFAANRKHAELIVKRFEALYPKIAKGGFIKKVAYTDDYSHTIIDEFKLKDLPVITVSVDMMDTGIDVPEILNLVFFKQVRSKTKFWQMIGRGTRLCEGLYPQDSIDGEYEDKRRFYIFDYCGNFEFFREGKKEVEGREPASLSELVFCRKAELVKAMQTSRFADDAYQQWRSKLVTDMARMAAELDRNHVAVKLRLREVDKFSQEGNYTALTDMDLVDLQKGVAPLVHVEEKDNYALRFDVLMYGFMCAIAAELKTSAYQRRLLGVTAALEQKITIPQIREKLPVIQRVNTEGFLDTASILDLESIRIDLRDLIKFLVGQERPVVVTSLTDPVIGRKVGENVDIGEDFADYTLKVNRYITENADNPVISKLHKNVPLTASDLSELERILTSELGTAKDYETAFGDTPFGLMVRKIVKLDHEAAMAAFAEFINDESLNAAQIAFVHKVVDYVENNGYMDAAALVKAPFDRPTSFFKLFDDSRQKQLVALINEVRDNAMKPAA